MRIELDLIELSDQMANPACGRSCVALFRALAECKRTGAIERTRVFVNNAEIFPEGLAALIAKTSSDLASALIAKAQSDVD